MIFPVNSFHLRRTMIGVPILVLLIGLVYGQSPQENPESRTKEIRQMWQTIVTRRPRRVTKITRTSPSKSNTPANNQNEKADQQDAEPEKGEPAPEYRMTGPMLPSEGQDIGITVWRLRLARPNDPSSVVQRIETKRIRHPPPGASGGITSLTPERIDANIPLFEHDLVQLSVEAPPDRFVYVINRELYADGDTIYGSPFLIFPTLRTNQGFNRMEPGILINIPSMSDNPPFFEVERSSQNHMGEELTFVFSPAKIAEFDGKPDQTELSKDQFQRVLRWAADTGRIELIKGVGQSQTSEEAEASRASNTKRLKHNSAMPQMIFRVAKKSTETFTLTIVLRIAS